MGVGGRRRRGEEISQLGVKLRQRGEQTRQETDTHAAPDWLQSRKLGKHEPLRFEQSYPLH